MPHGANININKQNGTKPKQQNRKICWPHVEKENPNYVLMTLEDLYVTPMRS